MRAQFEGLSFTGNIPYPSQFVGDKAVERLYRYMKKNNVKAQKPKSMSWLNLGKLKSIEDGTTGIACMNTNRKFIGIELDDRLS